MPNQTKIGSESERNQFQTKAKHIPNRIEIRSQSNPSKIGSESNLTEPVLNEPHRNRSDPNRTGKVPSKTPIVSESKRNRFEPIKIMFRVEAKSAANRAKLAPNRTNIGSESNAIEPSRSRTEPKSAPHRIEPKSLPNQSIIGIGDDRIRTLHC